MALRLTHGLMFAALSTTFVLALTDVLAQQPPNPAPQGAGENKPKTTADKPSADKIAVHGGQAWTSKEHAFEVVFRKDAIQVYVYDMKGVPVSAAGLSGTIGVDFKTEGESARTLTLKTVTPKDKGARDYLAADIDLSKAKKDDFATSVKIGGLKSETEKEVTFDLKFSGLSPDVRYVCQKCKVDVADPGECGMCHATLEKIVKPSQAP